MDGGLVVQWPLSPYATALAAGALVAICVALWKNYSSSGHSTGKDNDDGDVSKNLSLWTNHSCAYRDVEKFSSIIHRSGKGKQEYAHQIINSKVNLWKQIFWTCREKDIFCRGIRDIRIEQKTLYVPLNVNYFDPLLISGENYFNDGNFNKSLVLCLSDNRKIGNLFDTDISSSDLDPPNKKDADEKKKEEKETGNRNFPGLDFPEITPDFSHLWSTARFGAIPRTVFSQREHHTLQFSQILSPFRRRNNDLANRNWSLQNNLSLASSLPCIYQQSPSSEVPRINTRFMLNSSPYLNQYFRPFHSLRDFRIPEFTRRNEFENFDVSLNPEILKDKPLTRTAVRLTLEKQLHKFLNQDSTQETKFNERETQTLSVNSENDDFSSEKNLCRFRNNIRTKCDCNDFSRPISASSSLFDSGYYERPYSEPCSPVERNNVAITDHCNELRTSDTYRHSESQRDQHNQRLLACSLDYNTDNRCNSSNEYYKDGTFLEGGSKSKQNSNVPKRRNLLELNNQYGDAFNNELIDYADNDSPESTLNCDETLNDLSDFSNDTSHLCTQYCVKTSTNTNNSTQNDSIKIDCTATNDLNDPAENNLADSLDKCAESLNDSSESPDNSPDDTLHCVDTIKELNDSSGSSSTDSTLKCDETLSDLSPIPEDINVNKSLILRKSSDNLNSVENMCDSTSKDEIKNTEEEINVTSEESVHTCLNKDFKVIENAECGEEYKEMTLSNETQNNLKINGDSNQSIHIFSNDKVEYNKNSECEKECEDAILPKEMKNSLKINDENVKFKSDYIEAVKNSVKECGEINPAKEVGNDFCLHFKINDGSVQSVEMRSYVKSQDDNTSQIANEYKLVSPITTEAIKSLTLGFQKLELERLQETLSSLEREGHVISDDENILRIPENILEHEKSQFHATRASGVDAKNDKLIPHFETSNLERIQTARSDSGKENGDSSLSSALKPESYSRVVLENDVTRVSSRDPEEFDEKETRTVSRQMDRETGERSVAVESTVTTETTLRDGRVSTAVVSRLTFDDDWSADREDSVSVKTTVTEEIYRPTFEEFIPESSKRIIKNEDGVSVKISEKNAKDSGNDPVQFLPPDDRLKRLLSRDEERRSRTKFQHLATDECHVEGARMEGEWDRLLRDVLANVSELERWEQRECDVRSNAEDAEQDPSLSQSDSSFVMEEEVLSPNKGETPTKIKNLRFKLDPDVFDVPSDDSFYDDNDDDVRKGWKKQTKYRAFSSLELNDEPVRLVSVHASVVPAGQKMVARPVGIDLRVRLTEERQSKRAHVSTSPSQAKRRSPVSDRGVGWCQELSPVTENVDWRDTFTPVTPAECTPKSVPNGILKTPSPKMDPPPVESPNPFKLENGVKTNGVSPVIEQKCVEKPKHNGLPWKPTERKPFSLPRKKFEPDPEAIERITGYKIALTKPPLPPPVYDKAHASKILAIKKAELARKQYLDNRAALSASKMDSAQKFQQFLNQAQSDRARIVTSVPDLAAIEKAVTEQWLKERASVSPRESPMKENGIKSDDVDSTRGSTPDDKWASYVQSCRQHLGRRSQSMTYLETDIDIIPILDDDDKCVSTSALDESDEALPDVDDSDMDRSREDLDDSGRAKSEHELRIERSLRNMPVPDWYKRSEKTKSGFLLNHSSKEKRGWAAAKSLASSTSSLASCGLRRPVRSLRSSRENIPWSRASASPDGPTLSLALAKAFREPYLGWRARTPTSSGVSSSPRASPPSWNATTTDDEANGVSFDGEDAFGRTTSSEEDRRDEPLSLDDTGADAVTVSMDTNDPVKLPGGEDTCDDINNMSMETCEMFDASIVAPSVDEEPSLQADTGDDIDNLSTDTTTEARKMESKLDIKQNPKIIDPKLKRYSYSQSIYHSELAKENDSRGDRKIKLDETRELSPTSNDHKVVWIESSFVGSRTTTSILVLPEEDPNMAPENTQERPASR